MQAQSLSPKRALIWFGCKQALRRAVIIGLVAGFMLALQGVAYQKTYPDAAARDKFAKSLASAPGLGFLYGDPKNLDAGTAGYMVYRVLGFMGVVTSVWALTTTTRLLRGSEEDGHWEVVRTGGITTRAATTYPMLGFSITWCIAIAISLLMTVSATASANISMSFYAILLLNLAIFVPALLFGGVGLLTSQLGLTRQRALLYGLVPLGVLFLLRGVANSVHSLHWLSVWTPFGWAELVNPVLAPQPWWLAPFIGLGGLLAGLGIYLAQRDYGSSVIQQSEIVRPRYSMLSNTWSLAFRQNIWTIAGWTLGALWLIGLMAALTTTAINATADSDSLSRSLHSLAGNTASLKLAFLGAGLVFLAMILLIFSITLLGTIRRDEAKQYLDNILVGPLRRSDWLIGRLLLSFGTVLAVSLMCGLLLYAVATSQNISLSLAKVLATSVCAVGSVGFMIGLGALVYGLSPRLTTLIMYVAVGWSFLIALVASAAKLNSAIVHSSLFYYISFNLAKWPDWGTFGILMLIGVALGAAGVVAFNRRDIIPE